MPYGADPTEAPAQSGGYGKDPTKKPDAAPAATQEEQPSALGALFRGFLKGFSVAGSPPAILPGAAANMQKVEGAIDQGAQQAAAAHPVAAGAGRIAGNVAATAPLMGGGAGVSLPARMGLGAARGAVAGAMTPGGGAPGAAIGAGVGAAIPGVGAALAPAMPTVEQFAQNVAGRFPHLMNFLRGSEERTVDGFDRSVARQVLAPIGGDVPRNLKAGHGLVDHVYDQLDRAYEDIKPSLSLNLDTGQGAWQTYEPELQRIRGELSDEGWQKGFDNFIRNRITNRFDKNGVMDGEAWKDAEHDLTKRINQLHGTNNAELADALSEARDLFRDSLTKQNPAQAPQLANINQAYSAFYRMSKAASGKSAEGKFTPSDLLGAIRQQEKNPHAFARGKAMAGGPAIQGGPDQGQSVLQAYGRLGEKALKRAPIGPIDIMHAFHPSSMIRAATRVGAYPAGRAVKATAPLTAPAAGRAAVSRFEEPKASDRMKAQRKVSEIQRDLYTAKRRGDLATAQELQGKLADADAEYRKLRAPA